MPTQRHLDAIVDALLQGGSLDEVAAAFEGSLLNAARLGTESDHAQFEQLLRRIDVLIRARVTGLKSRAVDRLADLADAAGAWESLTAAEFRATESARRTCIAILKLDLWPARRAASTKPDWRDVLDRAAPSPSPQPTPASGGTAVHLDTRDAEPASRPRNHPREGIETPVPGDTQSARPPNKQPPRQAGTPETPLLQRHQLKRRSRSAGMAVTTQFLETAGTLDTPVTDVGVQHFGLPPPHE